MFYSFDLDLDPMNLVLIPRYGMYGQDVSAYQK